MPLVDRDPAKVPPNAVQLVAFVELHVSVDVALPAPGVTFTGFAVRITVGEGDCAGTKFTVTLSLAEPPAPVQFNWYVVVALGVINSELIVAFVPVKPPPDAVHDVAFVVVHESVVVAVDAEPPFTVVREATRSTVGADGVRITFTVADCETLPPAPVQLNEYVVVAFGDTLKVPEVVVAPLQPPLFVHDEAFVVLQERSDADPCWIVVGFAVKVSVGATGGAVTVTVTLSLAEPPAPVQVIV